jgi:haloalkane dehalogenase
VTANTFLPTGDVPAGKAFLAWKEYSQTTPEFRCGGIVRGACVTQVAPDGRGRVRRPFPDDRYKAARGSSRPRARDARRSGGARQP